MDMFDFSKILEFMKFEPGHNLVQCILLYMIWMSSRGLRRDIASLRTDLAQETLTTNKKFQEHDKILEAHEGRITVLESKNKN